jgi:hypothetical protein
VQARPMNAFFIIRFSSEFYGLSAKLLIRNAKP